MADPAPVPLVALLTAVDDPRRPQARRHSLEAILLIATLAVICGADNGTEVEFFGHQKQAWLETFLELPHGVPSHDTFGLLDPAPREACFAAWMQSLAATLQDGVVAVYGKAARAWSAPGRTRPGWCWASGGWTAGPPRARPSRPCSRPWPWTAAS